MRAKQDMASTSWHTRLPLVMSFPPPEIRQAIAQDDWTACIEAWTVICQAHLQSKPDDFAKISQHSKSLVDFLKSFVNEIAGDHNDEKKVQAVQCQPLRRVTLFLLHRILVEVKIPPDKLLEWTLLADVSRIYLGNESVIKLLDVIYDCNHAQIDISLSRCKKLLVKHLDNDASVTIDDDLGAVYDRLLPLVRMCSGVGSYLVTGSELIDSVLAGYQNISELLRPKIVMLLYLSFRALIHGSKPNHSLLVDHLYSIVEASKLRNKNENPNQFLVDLVSNTPLISKMRKDNAGADAKRTCTLLTSLQQFQLPRKGRLMRQDRRRTDKGKTPSHNEYSNPNLEEVHIHQMSLITQIQDLFPDLGSAFIIKLLDQYDDNVEQVISHLLDDSLPLHLKQADQCEPLHVHNPETNDLVPDLAPHSTPPHSPLPERRNVFDDDQFDRLSVDASRLHVGRKNKSVTADTVLADRSNHSTNKAAILAALAAFDADDDERDDTYDIADVGGTVDSARLGGADETEEDADDVREKSEEVLFSAYRMNLACFDRDSTTRKSKARQALKTETGMTDEALEGWAIMVKRDPRRLKRLEAKYAAFAGQQIELQSTAWRRNIGGSATEDSETSGAEGSGAGSSNRGRGRGRGQGRSRGHNAAGPGDEKGTQIARQRKEANKGTRANHNRREGRAHKIARAGLPG